MKFQESYDFDYNSDTILRMFTDYDYYVKKYQRLGGTDPEILDYSEDDEAFSIRLRHALDTANMNFPDFVKRRIGDRLLLRQTDRWQAADKSGRVVIDMEKMPASITLDMAVEDTNGTARLTLNFAIDVAIPLIGNKAEKAIAGPMTRHMRKDLDLSNRLAADYAA